MYTTEDYKMMLAMWQVHLNRCIGEISADGIYYKGEYQNLVDNFGNKYRLRISGNEAEQWNNAERRILFICKSPLQGIRSGSRFKDTVNQDLTHNTDGNLAFPNRFNSDILRLAAGLQTVTSDGFTPYNEVNSIEYLDKMWQQTAVARINVIKDFADIITIKDKLPLAIKYFGKMLRKQIEMLDPNIIVCARDLRDMLCHIFDNCYGDFVYFHQKPKIEKVSIEGIQDRRKRLDAINKTYDLNRYNFWVSYSRTHNVWVINSYYCLDLHDICNYPREPGLTEEEQYTKVMYYFVKALKESGIRKPIRSANNITRNETS